MPTLKQRISITVNTDTGLALKKLAKMHKMPKISRKSKVPLT